MLWQDIMSDEAHQRAVELTHRARLEREAGHVIYPPEGLVMRALRKTPPDTVKAVIVGQDPYVREGQAEGLAFSVSPGTPFPPSLVNIFTELEHDLGCPRPTSGSLLPWARQGVLLLNTSLTVEAGRPASHTDWGWDVVTHEILRVASDLPQPIVFICWGAHAHRVVAPLGIEAKPNKALIESSHPSPLSATRGFLGSRPFSKANGLLEKMGAAPIDWRLP